MKSKILLITGASRGIGLSLAKSALEKGFTVYNFSRTEGEFKHPNLIFYHLDLALNQQAIEMFKSVIHSIDFSQVEIIGLINNAGVLDPMYQMGKKSNPKLIEQHFTINVISPITFCEYFIFVMKEFSGYKFILNVGSGAADNPYEGWANYGASKAALHYFSRTVALEQKNETNPVIISLFNPGRTNTQMQAKIRNTSSDDFPFTESFIQAFEQGKLNSPDKMAEKLIDKIISKSIKQGDEISHSELIY